MNVYFFLQQRTHVICHFYDAASAPFLETKQCISESRALFNEPPYDDSGEVPERGQVLRQALPFAGLLTDAEIRKFLKSWSELEERLDS